MGKLHNWRYKGDRPTGANLLLSGEEQGFAIDATVEDGLVTVRDITTPSHNMNNVSLDSSFLVNSGTSPKLVHWNSTPYVRWTPHNFSVDSENVSTGNWGGTNVTLPSADTTRATATNSQHYFYQAISSLISGLAYTVTVDIKPDGYTEIEPVFVAGGTNGAHFNLTGAGSVNTYGGGTGTVTLLEDGWYRCTITATPGAASGYFQFYFYEAGSGSFLGDITKGFKIRKFQWNRGYISTPYLKTTSASRIGIPQEWDRETGQFTLLSEYQKTNLCPYSTDFSGHWDSAYTTVTASNILAPDGTLTASKFVEDTDDMYHQLLNQTYPCTITANQFYCVSCYIKPIPNSPQRNIGISFYQLANPWNNFSAYIDIQNQKVIASWSDGGVFTAAGIIPIGNDGWYRIWAAGKVDTTTTTASVVIYPLLGTSDGYAGNPAAGFYVWGAQAESGTLLTSLIPTNGATVTRAADGINSPTSVLPYNSSEGTMYCSNRIRDLLDYSCWIQFDDGTNNNKWQPYYAGDGSYYHIVKSGGGFDVTDYVPWDIGRRPQITCAAKQNDFAITLQGNTVVTDTGGNMPSGVNEFWINWGYDGQLYKFTYVPRRVGNTELPYWRYDSYCPQATSFFARLAIQPTTERKILYNNLIKKMVADGVWAKLDFFYILAAEHQSHAMENLIQGKYTTTKETASGRFIKDRGAVNCGLNTHFNSGATSPNYSVSSGFASCWYLNSKMGGGIYEYADYSIFLGPGGGNARIGGSYAGGYNMTFASTAAGMWAMSRTSVTNVNLYVNGAADANSPATTASDGQWFSDHDVKVGGSESPTAMAAIGSSLTATEVTNLYNAVRTYLVGVGAIKP